MASGDKRTVSTDALETLGKIHTRQEKRDAIHLAVEPVTAGERFSPGERIRIENGVAWSAGRNAHGIVDPFIEGHVDVGDRFWFVMMPRMVHSLRHVWTHPEFPDEPEVPATDPSEIDQAKERIRVLAGEQGLSVDEIMEGAAHYLATGHYLHMGHDIDYDWDSNGFWRAYEIVTGTRVDDNPGLFFSCSC